MKFREGVLGRESWNGQLESRPCRQECLSAEGFTSLKAGFQQGTKTAGILKEMKISKGIEMVEPRGVEPLTFSLRTRRSTN